MNVLYIANSNEIGGGNRSLELLMTGMSQHGITPIVIVPEEGPAADLFRERGIRVLISSLPPPNLSGALKFVLFTFKMRAFLKKENIRLVHTNGTIAARSMATLCKKNNIPLVTHVRFDLGGEYYQWAFKKIPAPQHFIFVSHHMHQTITPHLHSAKSDSFSVIHNAVLDKAVSVNPPQHTQVTHIGIIANLQKVKGHEDFLDMAKRLLVNRPYLHFHIIGGDNQKQGRDAELKMYAEKLDISKSVTFHGFVLDVDEKIKNLDLVVCPSHEEPFGRCAIEAMQFGKPVVVTKVGGLPEIVEEGVNGHVVQPHNPEALAEAVEKIIHADYGQLSSNNIKKIKKLFSKEKHITQVLEVYHSLTK
jgi:glycosyltransferase involved in cell wall biosynthesis